MVENYFYTFRDRYSIDTFWYVIICLFLIYYNKKKRQKLRK